jgi:phosphoglycerate dehydrogenase-like enzyme
MNDPAKFRIALTADFYDASGAVRYQDIGLDLLAKQPRFEVTRLAEHRAVVEPQQFAAVNGAIVLSPRVNAESLLNSDDLLAIGRFGVGYDSVDVAACTAAGVVLFITTGAVDHSVAEATVGWMLALSHHMRIKDQLVRSGEWDARSRFMGSELRQRTLGLIGFGGIGKAVVKILRGFDMAPPLIFDPFISDQDAFQAGAHKASLDELLAQADFVSLHCPLNEQTRNLLGARELALMKPSAYLLNTARGGIVNEDALYAALNECRIGGAALDCFENEPLKSPPRWAALDNVLLAPHSIAWTHELFRDIGRCACQGMIDLAAGRKPKGVVNPGVFVNPTFQAKWQRWGGA